MANPREQIDALKGIAVRRLPLLIVAFLMALAPIQTGITFLPALYQSTATVLIADQQIPRELVRPTVTTGLDTRLQSISQEILSRSQLAELIERFGLRRSPEDDGVPIHQLAATMRRDIKIEMQGSGGAGTVAFTITYRGTDPKKVADVTNTLAAMFAEANLEIRSQQASSTSAFLQSQLDEMAQRLSDIESQVGAFKSAHVGELPHQQEANLATLGQLNTRLQINSEHQTRLSERITVLENQLGEASRIVDPSGPDAAAVQLAELEVELRELRANYSEKYPAVVRVREEIEALEARLNETEETPTENQNLSTGSNDTFQRLERELELARIEFKARQTEAASLKESIVTYEARVKAAPLTEQRYQVMMRDYDTTAELYRSLLLRQKEAEIAENMERREKGERFQIIESAFPATAPSAPDPLRLRAAGLVLALMFAAALVFAAEKLDGSYHSLREFQRASEIPVLANIPELITPRDRKRRLLRLALACSVTAVAVVAASAAAYVICDGNYQIVGHLMW